MVMEPHSSVKNASTVACRGLVKTRQLSATNLMDKTELIKYMGQRLYVRYSIFDCVGTLVSIDGDVALFDTSHQIWIPCIESISTEIPKPRPVPASSLPTNLLDLFQ